MLLITESNFENVEVLVESAEGGGKNYYLEGIFMQGAVKNRNGRIYPTAVLEKEMKRYNESYVREKRALGELGHPAGPQINADRVSHYIVEMRRDGDNFIGKAKVMDTPMGKILKNFIDEGIKTGVSTRGLGSVKESKNGVMEVQGDFYLAAIDSVTDPSGPNCFVKGIMENAEYYFDIATSSWQQASGEQANILSETVDTKYATTKDLIDLNSKIEEIKNLDFLESFNIAMSRLEKLEEEMRRIKTNYARPSMKIDESKASKIFEDFVRTLNKG
jgi:hypothetical protein